MNHRPTSDQTAASKLWRPEFPIEPLPKQLCNYDRLLSTLEERGLDGIVMTSRYNVLYLSSFHPNAYHQDEPPHTAVIISRHAPDHPIVIVVEELLTFFLHQPSWVQDIRPFRSVSTPLDLPTSPRDVDNFLPAESLGFDWIQNAREKYSVNRLEAIRTAIADLALSRGRVAFDHLGLAKALAMPHVDIVDGSGALMFTRQVKTPPEIHLLRQAHEINQRCIYRAVRAWDRGMTWQELNFAYRKATVEVGGHIDDPRGLVFANPRGSDPVVTLNCGLDDFAIEPGMHIMFDCHGTWNMYCWDGGKTWTVDDEPTGRDTDIARATKSALQELESAMRPGSRISELQAKARQVYRGFGLNQDDVRIFFHGMGLSHSDLEQTVEEGKPYPDYSLEEGMVLATHLLVPGGERSRYWAEDVVVVQPGGGESLYSWEFDPITGRGE